MMIQIVRTLKTLQAVVVAEGFSSQDLILGGLWQPINCTIIVIIRIVMVVVVVIVKSATDKET